LGSFQLGSYFSSTGNIQAMSGRLKDEVAVVLGAGSSGPGWGNGKAAAVLFAREGAKIFAVDLRREAAEETRETITAEGGDATSFTADVSKAHDMESLVDACIKAYGGIDILLNKVGILGGGWPGGNVGRSLGPSARRKCQDCISQLQIHSADSGPQVRQCEC
jgi:NAD(P)-dependent dehydrogenase (short-subunit alcohol dehydrogenase family)